MRTQDVVNQVVEEYIRNHGVTALPPALNVNHDSDFNRNIKVKFMPATDGKLWPYQEKHDKVWPYNSKRI